MVFLCYACNIRQELPFQNYHWLGAYSTYMLCTVDKSLSVFMTWRIVYIILLSFRFLFVFFLLFGFKPLGKGILLIYVFMMAVFGNG